MTPKKQNKSRFSDELIDQLLAKYEKPEDSQHIATARKHLAWGSP